ncbi:MAG: hypothetical protein ACI88H_000749 [Cocleimonas sp.]|jgi:hypothetical protein
MKMNAINKYLPHQQSKNVQWLIVLILLIVMTVTRSGYVPHLQDASWAIFFLIGFYCRSYLGFSVIILTAIAVDFAMIAARGGHQDYYLTPSYLFIIPAYGALWFSGRYLASKYSESFKGLITFLGLAIIGIVACDLISSGGFYWMSAPEVEVSISEFTNRFMEFMPLYLKSTMLYLSVAAAIHMAFRHTLKSTNTQQTRRT